MPDTDIRINITANDNASASINKVKSNINSVSALKIKGNTFDGIKNSAEKSASSLLHLQQTAGNIGNAFSRAASAAQRALDSMRGSADKTTKSVEGIQQPAGNAGAVFSKLAGLAGKAFAVASIADFSKRCLEASANAELLRKGLARSLGAADAEKLISDVQAIGEASAYDATQLLPLSRAWVNIGDNAEQATDKMRTIVDISSAYGLTADQVGAVNLALSQMQMAGKIGQQDMMQLLNAGVPAWQLLSEKMGLSVAQLKDMSSSGELTQEAIDALFEIMKEKGDGAASDMANTLAGKFSNIEESAANSMSAIGEIITDAFDLKNVLGSIGEFVGSFKAALIEVKDAAKNVGVTQAITDQLEKVSPVAASAFGTISSALKDIGSFCKENSGLIKAVGEAVMIVGSAFLSLKGIIAICTTAAKIFTAVATMNPYVLGITAVIAALVLIHDNWDEISKAASQCWQSVTETMERIKTSIIEKFNGAIDSVKQTWNEFTNFLAHPIDTVINITRNVASRYSSGGVNDPMPDAKGGVFGVHAMAKGGLVGGLVPMATGGELKRGTPALVGEAGPEAVIPLKNTVLSQIGKAIADAYNGGKAGRTKVGEIEESIKTTADTGEVNAYVKVLQDASKKAQEIGQKVKEFSDYQKDANDEAKKYAETGEETISMQEKLASKEREISKLKASRSGADTAEGLEARLSQLEAEKAQISATYEAKKAAAIKAAQEAADAKTRIEQEAADAVKQVQTKAAEDVFSHETTLRNAKAALDKAANAQSLSEYAAIMSQKDEVTGESYASILANENALGETRRAWYEEMMLNAVSWGTYMQETLTTVAEQFQSGVAQGLTECIMQGKTLSDMFGSLANTLLSTLINNVLKKWISSMGIIQSLNAANSKTAMANAKAEAAAQAAKSGVYAANATARVIETMPFMVYGAGALVAAQMQTAKVGALQFATGGYVSGTGTSTSDSIPTMLSNGEYVLNAQAVQAIGRPTLNMLNSGAISGLASGGSVGGGADIGIRPSSNVTLNVSALDASSFSDFLQRDGGKALKQFLLDTDRDYTGSSDVW